MSAIDIKQLKSGIVTADYPLHAAVTKLLLEEEWQALEALSSWPICYLIRFRGVSLVEDDITDFIQQHYRDSRLKAVAIVFNSDYGYFEHGKILINAFLHLSEINFPVRKFENEAEAIGWLETYL